ncbi:PRC-barrel domain-containing protein [Patescibacteria group bacterium]|nr:PRC-barrel domain-containing protein [Patescibacteria group bacterium]
MFIKAKKIIGKKVVSQSNYYLGKVVDFEIDTLSYKIVKFYTQGELLNFLREPLVINIDQVIEIQKDRIIVEDAVVPKKITKKTTPDIEYAQ